MAIDAIEVLDNLQFNQQDTAEIWAIDGEGSAYDVVKSFAVSIPPDISAARVIFNNWYDTAASQVTVRVKVTKLTAIGTLTKTENTQVIEWTDMILYASFAAVNKAAGDSLVITWQLTFA